jgi:hypothetical protein
MREVDGEVLEVSNLGQPEGVLLFSDRPPDASTRALAAVRAAERAAADAAASPEADGSAASPEAEADADAAVAAVLARQLAVAGIGQGAPGAVGRLVDTAGRTLECFVDVFQVTTGWLAGWLAD